MKKILQEILLFMVGTGIIYFFYSFRERLQSERFDEGLIIFVIGAGVLLLSLQGLKIMELIGEFLKKEDPSDEGSIQITVEEVL